MIFLTPWKLELDFSSYNKYHYTRRTIYSSKYTVPLLYYVYQQHNGRWSSNTHKDDFYSAIECMKEVDDYLIRNKFYLIKDNKELERFERKLKLLL